MKIQWTTILPCILLLIFGVSASRKTSRFDTLVRLYRPYIPDVNYGDIQRLNAACGGRDTCRIPRTDDPWRYNCNCEETCSYLGSCCIDAKYRLLTKYRQKNRKNLECRQLNHRRDFLYPYVSTCNPDMRYDNTTAELCLGRGCALNDAFAEIPVTDPVTGITYKNYFCFACNENSGEERLIQWNVAIGIGYTGNTLEKINRSTEVPTLKNYKKDCWEWVADNDNSSTYSIWPSVPEEVENILPFCFAFNIVNDCASDWRDKNVRRKCLSYMAMARITTDDDGLGRPIYRYYQNPHCAICNYESLDNMVCVAEQEYPISAEGGLIPSGDFFVRLFSLHDKSEQCRDRMIYDKTSKRCRNIYKARKLV